jgi:hypothetical protein
MIFLWIAYYIVLAIILVAAVRFIRKIPKVY